MKRQWMLTGVSVLLCCCLFVFVPSHVFASSGSPPSQYYKNVILYLYPSNATSTSDADLYCSWMISDLQEETEVNEEWMLCKFIIRNTTSNDLIIPSTYISVKPTFTFSGAWNDIIDYEYISGQIMVDRLNTNGTFYFTNSPDHSLFSYIIIPANGDISCVFKLKWGTVVSNITNFTIAWNQPALPFTPVVVQSGDVLVSSYQEYLKWIYFRLNTIYDAILDNAQQGTSTDIDAGDTQTEIETIHGTEQTWYTATETALEGTGLTSFQFTGMSTVAMNDFTHLWGDIDKYVIVPTFALSIKLATTIIRHMPRRKRMSEKDD